MSICLVLFNVYPPLLSFVFVSIVPGLPMHLYDILGSLLCSFSVEVSVGDFLAFVEAL